MLDRLRHLSAIGAMVALLSGCEIPHASVTPEGELEVFGATARFSEAGPPDSWVFRELTDANRPFVFSAAPGEAGSVLTVRTTTGPYLALQRTRARLLASPFLDWTWRMGGHDGETHPVRLLIGFHGGNPTSGSLGSTPFANIGSPIPPFDRAIAITWHQSALKRGATAPKPKVSEYAARGGLENTGKWWRETLDLADLYRRFWPGDEMVDVVVMFIGFSVGADERAVTGEFAQIRLTR